MAHNDDWIYENDYSGQTRTGRSLDPSGSGYVPSLWFRVEDENTDKDN